MASMLFLVKYFSEIAIKSKPVRRAFLRQLNENMNAVLREVDANVSVERDWDKFLVRSSSNEPGHVARMVDAMCRISGITYVMEVDEYPVPAIEQIADFVLPVYKERLKGATFAVRCKRNGKHGFSSVDVERTVGSALMLQTDAAGVKLKNPDVTVRLEVNRDALFVIGERHSGPSGYPLGSLDPVLSLISGGFDSPVASYLTMKRGMRTHFLFFNLGGRDHELGVKEVALYLWEKYGNKQRVLFISVPFEEVVAELLKNVQDSYMGVVLKRMMLRVADRLAQTLEIPALVTGECVAQVSSQTLQNLSVIDKVTDRLILRPLIASDKEDIVRLAARIGTEEFAASMPEYCGVISVKPTTRARLDRVAAQEQKFDLEILDRAFEARQQTRIDLLAEEALERSDVEVLTVPLAGSTIIDIRHPEEEELAPLEIHVPVLKIPFFELHTRKSELGANGTYMLYCGQGVMSRLHAGHLQQESALEVKVYAPQGQR